MACGLAVGFAAHKARTYYGPYILWPVHTRAHTYIHTATACGLVGGFAAGAVPEGRSDRARSDDIPF